MCVHNLKFYTFFIVFIFCLFTQFIHAQEVDKLETHKAYDAIVHGNNSGYYNGPEFQDVYLTNTGSNRYLKQFDFSIGSITYKNQTYFDVLLKYDIYEDQLITRSDDDLKLFKVNLISDYITEFKIHNREFVKIPELDDGNAIRFYEIGHKGENLSLFIKHHKRKKEINVNFTLRYDFIPANYYVLYKNYSYQEFESIKNLKNLLPQQEKQIQNYYKKNKSVYKSDIDRFMIDLFRDLNSQTN